MACKTKNRIYTSRKIRDKCKKCIVTCFPVHNGSGLNIAGGNRNISLSEFDMKIFCPGLPGKGPIPVIDTPEL